MFVSEGRRGIEEEAQKAIFIFIFSVSALLEILMEKIELSVMCNFKKLNKEKRTAILYHVLELMSWMWSFTQLQSDVD